VNTSRRVYLLVKELGLSQLIPYALYKGQLRSGKFESLHAGPRPTLADPLQALRKAFLLDPHLTLGNHEQKMVISLADEIVSGNFPAFSGESARIDLSPHETTLKHWTKYSDTVNGSDIKTLWEPARFGWVFPLCQAYLVEHEDKYPATFWTNFEKFFQENPENMGAHWVSAQEAALRLIPWILAVQVFADNSETTQPRLDNLLTAIWQHTYRISITLNYSRSQNNNHFLSEALGLMIGGAVFTETPTGRHWFRSGAAYFQAGIDQQIDNEGTYSQHSANYHRLMIHLALLFKLLANRDNISLSSRTNKKLSMATRWLTSQLDPVSGRLPNLGHNDGSNLLPIGGEDYLDYRSTVQAASRAFLGGPCLPAGPWDELSSWLGLIHEDEKLLACSQLTSPAVHSIENGNCRAFLRSAQFHSRPAHADLLSVDLWQDGINLLMDAGTYAYNLPEPWQNRLSGSMVHNTITVNGQDQMVRDSKFLWIDRARSLPLPSDTNTIGAILYCNLSCAYTQIRTIGFPKSGEFQVLDRIEFARLEKKPLQVTIQYLVPDWDWTLDKNSLSLSNKGKQVQLILIGRDPHDQSIVPGMISLVRAGETLRGKEKNLIRGWFSPTYLVKVPALSIAATFETTKSLEILTRLIF